jgi:hypothetical protein
MTSMHPFGFASVLTIRSDGHASLKVGILFQDLQVGLHKVLRHKRLLWRHWLYIAALRLEDGDLLAIATQTPLQSAIRDYAQRWGIKTALLHER